MTDKLRARPADQALAVPVEPASRLDPSGFDPSRWHPIETAPLETRVMLWCPERQRKDEAPCFVFGSVVKFSDGSRKVYGDGMNGDWLFTHWMPLPAPPAITAGTRSAKTT